MGFQHNALCCHSNYPSAQFFLYWLNPMQGCRRGWSLSRLWSSERRGTPWTGRQSIKPINLTCMFLNGGRKPGENRGMHRDDMHHTTMQPLIQTRISYNITIFYTPCFPRLWHFIKWKSWGFCYWLTDILAKLELSEIPDMLSDWNLFPCFHFSRKLLLRSP